MKLDPEDPARLVKDTYAKEAFFYQNLAPKLDKTLDNLWDGWRPHYYGWEELPGSKVNDGLILVGGRKRSGMPPVSMGP